jgi:hypothetical protein
LLFGVAVRLVLQCGEGNGQEGAQYIETKVMPVINKYWADDAFPTAAPAKY